MQESLKNTFVLLPQNYNSLKNWMDYRTNAGEEITPESWVMRNLWQTTDFLYGAQWGLVKYPKQLKATDVKSLIERAMRAQRLAMPLPKGVKRREWKSGHGYRKFFKSRAEQVMHPANVSYLVDVILEFLVHTINQHRKRCLKIISKQSIF